MFNSKSDLYKNEWLDLVFANRNQLYGAYELRRNYSGRLARALFLSIALFTGLITTPFLYNRVTTNAIEPPALTTVVDYTRLVFKPELIEKKAPSVSKPKGAAVHAATKKYMVPTVAKPEEVIDEMPDQSELQHVSIGSENVEGKDLGQVGTGKGDEMQGNGTGMAETLSNEAFTSVEQMPEFPGGNEAFYKYLSKNIRYPALAQENNIQGRIIVSFIVERNGTLTDIRILSGIGGGCDEEAMRVIKKAPAWKPGVQNGQKVRVQYKVPVIFNL